MIRLKMSAVLGVTLTLACGAKSDSSGAKVRPDAADLMMVARIEARSRQHQPASDADVGQLRDLWTRYPSEAQIRAALQGVLALRQDWDGLVALEFEPASRAHSARDDLFLAKLYVKLGRYADARRILEKFGPALSPLQSTLEIDPDNVVAHSYLSRCFAALGRVSEANAHEAAALRLRTEDGERTVTEIFRRNHPESSREADPQHVHPLGAFERTASVGPAARPALTNDE